MPTIGALALEHEQRHVFLQHPRNRLTPVSQGSDPDHLYPSFVFRMLTFPDPSAGQTPRDELLRTWQRQLDAEVPAEEQDGVRQLLFGNGGQYSEASLRVRANMFEALESMVRGLARELELLDRALVVALASSPR